MKKLIVLWMVFLLSVMTITIWALVTVKPKTTVNCKKAMEAWNYFEGQAAIAAFTGLSARRDMLQESYTKLVMGPAHVCFPPSLIEYVVSN